MDKICSYPECGRKHYASGYCRQHNRIRLSGEDMRPIGPKGARGRGSINNKIGLPCEVQGCPKSIVHVDFCNAHYQQYQLGKTLRVNSRFANGQPCRESGCSDTGITSGFCGKHYYQNVSKPKRGKFLRPQSDWATHCLICLRWDTSLARGFCQTCRTRYERYGITVIQALMLDIKNAKCDICGDRDVNMHIDHDHSCCNFSYGKTCGMCVRGILCSRCNRGIGTLRDDTQLLKAAIEYIDRGRRIL